MKEIEMETINLNEPEGSQSIKNIFEHNHSDTFFKSIRYSTNITSNGSTYEITTKRSFCGLVDTNVIKGLNSSIIGVEHSKYHLRNVLILMLCLTSSVMYSTFVATQITIDFGIMFGIIVFIFCLALAMPICFILSRYLTSKNYLIKTIDGNIKISEHFIEKSKLDEFFYVVSDSHMV